MLEMLFNDHKITNMRTRDKIIVANGRLKTRFSIFRGDFNGFGAKS